MGRFWSRSLALACCLPLALVTAADDVKADLAALAAGSVASDTPSLLAFFKKRTLSDEARARITALIEQLGAPEFASREKATMDLLDLDGLGRAQIVQALKDDDAEIRKRARFILARIGAVANDAKLLAPAARVLASRKAEGAAKALLEFLPCAEDAAIAEEVAAAIDPLALTKSDRPDPAVLAALSDKSPVKRFAAGQALAKAAATRDFARALLKDADVGVRRRVAVALLEARDKEAVPALIALLPLAGGDDLSAVEEALLSLAGDKAPERVELDTPAAREANQKQWAAWWDANADKIDLAKVDFGAAYRGYTLVTTLNVKTTSGTVQELDAAGKVRWKVDNVIYPVHASMTRRDRVLVCEYNANRVTERDLKGKVVWTKNVSNMVMSAERLSNGNTFIVSRNQMLEVDKDGREVRSIPRPSLDLLGAHRHKDGRITALTRNGTCLRLDRNGNEVGSFTIGGFITTPVGFNAHFLEKGGIVVPDYSQSKLREFDANGKLIAEVNAYRPSAVVKLANGNYLYTSRQRSSLVEVDKTGKEVSRRDIDGVPLFIGRR